MSSINLIDAPEEAKIHLGLYSREAYDVLRFALKTCRHHYSVGDAKLGIAPDGEVIYRYLRPINDKKEELSIRRLLVSPLKRLLEKIAFDHHLNSGYEYIDVRNYQDNPSYSTPYAKKCFSLDSAGYFNMTTTMTHVALMIELIGCYRDRAKVLRDWRKSIKDAVIGEPRDPFTAGAIQALESELADVTSKKNAELSKKKAELSELGRKYKMCEDSWNDKIKDLENRIAELHMN